MSKQQVLEQNITSYLSGFNFDLQRFSAPSPKDLMVGAGKVFFRLWDNMGMPLVRRHMGNVESLNLTATIEKIQKMSSMDAAKELYAEAVKSMTYKLTLNLSEYNPFNLAMALYGEEGIEIQEEKTVTNELYDVILGSPISVPYKNITDIVIEPLASIPSSIGSAVSFAQVGVPGTGTITSSGRYTGATSGSYYITIAAANSTVGTITDATFTWKKGLGGVESAPTTITGQHKSSLKVSV